jgi:hypothetical protein
MRWAFRKKSFTSFKKNQMNSGGSLNSYMNRFCLAFSAVILAYQVAAGSFAHADGVSDACDYVSRKVSTFKGGLYRQGPETFEDEGKIYRGCVVIVVGDRNKVPGRFPPRTVPTPNRARRQPRRDGRRIEKPMAQMEPHIASRTVTFSVW